MKFPNMINVVIDPHLKKSSTIKFHRRKSSERSITSFMGWSIDGTSRKTPHYLKLGKGSIPETPAFKRSDTQASGITEGFESKNSSINNV